jgi:serine protease AprX
VAATGGGILNEKGYSGTSAAAPHVTGAIALMLQEKPLLSVDEIRAALAASARKDPAPVKEEVGAGRLNAFEAVKKVKP